MSYDVHRKCSKCGATPYRDEAVSLHRFPKLGKTNVLKLKAWAVYCWPEKDWTVELLENLFKKHHMLCGQHFEEYCFVDSSKKTLFPNSVPGTKEYVTKTLRVLEENSNFAYELQGHQDKINTEHTDFDQLNFTKNEVDCTLENKSCEEVSNSIEPAPTLNKKLVIAIEEQGLELPTNNPVPLFKQITSTIYQRQNTGASVSKIFSKEATELEVPVQFKQFVLADYCSNNIRILIFCSAEARLKMKTVKHFLIDGTFRNCPQPFSEMLTVHGDLGSWFNNAKIIPLIYAFLSHKDSDTYHILFQLIKIQIPDWNPKKITIDYENVIRKAALTFKSIDIVKGSYYYYKSRLWRKARTLGLNKLKHYRRIITLCCALALLPENEITAGWQYVKSQINEDTKLQKFKTYFEKTWMKPNLIKMWWHRTINKFVPKNVSLSQVLQLLYDKASLATFRSEQFKMNKMYLKRHLDDLKLNDFIQSVQLELISGDISVGHFLEKLR